MDKKEKWIDTDFDGEDGAIRYNYDSLEDPIGDSDGLKII